MIWSSWGDFFAMGGYGLYVWGSVIVTFGMMVGEIFALVIRRNIGIKEMRNRVRNLPKERRENKA